MGKRIDLVGKKIGCLTVSSIAASRKVKVGSRGYWNCICDCGQLIKKGAPKLVRAYRGLENAPHYCSVKCGLKMETLTCKCGAENYVSVFRANRIKKISGSWICRACSAKDVGLKNRGKPAHNRLPNNEGGFNSLFGSYKRAAKNRGIDFDLTVDNFKFLTKQDCHYCGKPPSSMKWTNQKASVRKGEPYIFNGIDRLSSNVGYFPYNVVACCTACNRMKGVMEYGEFITQIHKIYTIHEKEIMNQKKQETTRAPGSGKRTFFP